jgi:arabinose-5-phosphate isomerase
MNSSNIQSVAKRVIKIESEAVSLMAERIDQNFNDAVQSILECQGRLIVSGMGKSGLISQKIASTMASTGTPSHFVHPGEATHGDLGMIKKEDVVLIVSNSGETMELIQILPSLQKKGITIITTQMHITELFSNLLMSLKEILHVYIFIWQHAMRIKFQVGKPLMPEAMLR